MTVTRVLPQVSGPVHGSAPADVGQVEGRRQAEGGQDVATHPVGEHRTPARRVRITVGRVGAL